MCVTYLVQRVNAELLKALIIACFVRICSSLTSLTNGLFLGSILLLRHLFSDHCIIFQRSLIVIASPCCQVAAAPFALDWVLIASITAWMDGA